MFHLLCVVLHEPNVLLESDPCAKIYHLWKEHGIRNVATLNRIYLHDLTAPFERLDSHNWGKEAWDEEGQDELEFLFGLPQPPVTSEPEQQYRLLVALVLGGMAAVQAVVDATEKMLTSDPDGYYDLLFVFPLVTARDLWKPGQNHPRADETRSLAEKKVSGKA